MVVARMNCSRMGVEQSNRIRIVDLTTSTLPVQVMLAELKGSGSYFAVKALKKDVVLEDNDIECTMLERRVLELGTHCPYLTYLHSSFQSPVGILTRPSIRRRSARVS